ncbi:uncharacterized protein LOC130505199 isoform X2 [Raphanus sativus]|uniref:Uncharacterized protein LOC130505199 isoform X2 n=1 Tax=Raphanus sativus TaxID=3726 RepID=A0A9W3CVZ6_RAPSA|nr:uncharacterized protein LOC130505199 isoform X2 [Raphanus sativus]
MVETNNNSTDLTRNLKITNQKIYMRKWLRVKTKKILRRKVHPETNQNATSLSSSTPKLNSRAPPLEEIALSQTGILGWRIPALSQTGIPALS